MAIAAAPSQVVLQTGNGVNLLSWGIVSGALSYSVQRSIDGVNFTVVGTPTVAYYQDSSVTIGTNYYYSVASVNGSGTSAYTASSPNSITPCAPGQINLGYLRYQAKLRADMLNSNFVTQDEWDILINQSSQELYGLLVQKFGEDYFLAPLQVFSTSGQQFYPLPNGTNFLNINGIPNPSGTPAMDATENADITIPIAAPRRYSGMTSPTMARITAPVTPPKVPAMARAATSSG